MTTQYIGARYVPLFYTASDNSNNWESGVQYDPLTIVTDLNQSYTSKIPVPASVGRPSENPEYWVLTGAYNAQIEQYRQEVDNVSERIEEVDENFKKYVLVVSDSYGVSNGESQLSFVTFLDTLGIRNVVADWDYTAISGAAFSVWPNQKNFYDLLNEYANTNLISKITDIIVVGGTNDAKLGLTTTTIAGINSFCDLAETKFPNLKQISILYCSHVKLSNYDYPNTVATFNAYTSVKRNKLIFKNAINCFGWDNVTADGMHPTTNGAKELATNVIEYIRTGNINIIPRDAVVSQTPTPPELTVFSNITSVIKPISEDYVCIDIIAFASNHNGTDIPLSRIGFASGEALGEAVFVDVADQTKYIKPAWWQLLRDGNLHRVDIIPNVGRMNFNIIFSKIVPNYKIGFVA